MNLEKLKDTARKYEQKEDWRRAIDVYLKAIQEFESGKEQHPDLSLYNRVGDLYMKVNDTAAAVRSYERAADLYTEQGFLNNAIALCGKILRVNPSRTQIYFKLAQIHARKNMVVDAKRHLVEYLERMNRGGQLDDAFVAVKIFADQFSGNQEIRVMLIELLRAASRDEEAKEQLEKLAGDLEARGDRVGALRTREQIEAIDAGQAHEELPANAGGLVFLDIGSQIAAPADTATATPPSAPSHAPPEGEPEVPLPPLEFLDVGAPLEPSAAPAVMELEPLVEEPSFAEPAGTMRDDMLLGDIELSATEAPDLEVVEPLEGLERVDVTAPEVLAHERMELMLEPAFEAVTDLVAQPAEELELVDGELGREGLQELAGEPPPSDIAEVVVDLPGEPLGDADDEAPMDVDDDATDVVLSFDDLPDAAEAEPSELEVPSDDEFTVSDVVAAVPTVEIDSAAELPEPDVIGAAEAPLSLAGGSRTVEQLEELVLENPDDPVRHRELGEALLLQGETGRAVDEFELALSGYESAGDQDQAESLLALLITLQPEDVRFYQRRVEYAYRSGERDNLLGAYLDLADALARVQAEDKAIAVYWRVLEHEPDNARAQLALQLLGVLDLEPVADAEVDAPRDAPISEDLLESADIEPDSAEPAVSAAELERVEEPVAQAPPLVAPFVPAAESVDERRAEAAPPAARPLPPPGEFIDLGSLIIDEDQRPRDTRMTGQQVESTGDEQRDFEEMLAQFKKGIDANVDLDDYQAHYDLGVAFKEMGLYDEAVAEFQRALRAPEGRLRTSEALGMCFFEKGQHAVAEAVLRRAVDTLAGGDDEKIGLIYWLARAVEEQGKGSTARALYERVLAVDIRFQDTNERINRLTMGRP